jgi:hypothetical protein
MKKITKILSTAFVLASFYACNDGGMKKSRENKADSSKNNGLGVVTTIANQYDDCDYYVDEYEAYAMMGKYELDFNKKGLTKQFWMETCVLKSLHKFLNDNKGYDGIRFFLGARKRPFKEIESELIIVATTSTANPRMHTNQWDINIPMQSCPASQISINMGRDETKKRVNKFGKEFRNETADGDRNSASNDPLSIGIWISRCKIDKLIKLYESASDLDGLMAISAAYYHDDERRSRNEDRKYPVQSTLIFVPTKSGKIDLSIVAPPKAWKSGGGFNHGQLCPNNCE